MSSARRIPIERRDREWVDSTVTALCGPFDMPSVEALENAIVAVAQQHPESRIAWTLDSSRRWWQDGDPTDAVRERNMVVGREQGDADLGRILDEITTEKELAWPLALVRYEHYLGLRMSHAVGDGTMFNRVIAAVLGTAITGVVAPWPAGPPPRTPLLSAIGRTFRSPQRVRSAVADRPTRRPGRARGALRRWQPSRSTEVVTLTPAVTRSIAEWARVNAPGASKFAIHAVLYLRSLAAAGIEVEPRVSVVFDLRRYLAVDAVDGNFVAGVPLEVDARCSPTDVSRILRACASSGRPLATQAMTTLTRMRTNAPSQPAPDVEDGALPYVTFSSLGRPADVNALPFADPDNAVYLGSVEPDGPHGVTVLIIETAGGVHVMTSFHDNVLDRSLVRHAGHLISTDPVSLLCNEVRL